MAITKAKFSDAAITARVADILVSNLGIDVEEVTPDARLRDDLSADSLDVVEIAMALEEEFGIEVDDSEADKMVLVRDIVAHVSKKVAAKKV